MATVKLTAKPVAEAVQDGDQVVLIQGGAIKLLPADKLGNGGAYGFAVDEDGHLILTYEGDIPPNYTINSQGHLILTVGNNQTIDLGQVKGTNGKGVPSISSGDAGKFLQAGADGGQWADAPSDVVYVDTVAEGVNWILPSPQPVSEDFTSKVQEAYDGHKVLFVHAELAGMTSAMAMTTTGQYNQNDIIYTGSLYLNNAFLGVSMIIDIDQRTILPSMFILENGIDGVDGTTFTPSVSADGTLSWSNDGGLPNPEPVNIRGPAGTPGAQGEPGPATAVTVGDTVTGEPGTDATVTSTPTGDGIQLWFTIPRGQNGAQGPAGAPGKDNLPNVSALSGGTQSLALEDNVEYRCSDALASLTVTGFDAPEAGKAGLWSIQFTAGAGLSVVLPDTSVWAVAEPVWTEGCIYWLSWTQLVDGRYLCVWVEVPGDG